MGFTRVESVLLLLPFVYLICFVLVVKDAEAEGNNYPINPGIDSRNFPNTSASICGYTLTCKSGTVFYYPNDKFQNNFRCSFLILAENTTEYEVSIVNDFSVDGAGIFIAAFSLDNDNVDHTDIKDTGSKTIKGHALVVNIFTTKEFQYSGRINQPIIIDYKGTSTQNETPLSSYSSVTMIMPDSSYKHPLEFKPFTELPLKRELSMVGLLPKDNRLLTDQNHEPKLLSFRYRRLFQSNDQMCRLTRIMLYTVEMIEDLPKLSLQITICGKASVVSYDIYDVALVVIKSYREEDDRNRGFEIDFFQSK